MWGRGGETRGGMPARVAMPACYACGSAEGKGGRLGSSCCGGTAGWGSGGET